MSADDDWEVLPGRASSNASVNGKQRRASSIASVNGKQERRHSLRLKRKVALPDGGLRPGLGKNQVFCDRSASDDEHESSTEGLKPVSDAQRGKRTNTEGSSPMEEFINPSSIDAAEMEHICSAVLPTALHHPSTESESYALYIKEVLRLPDETFNTLYEKAERNESTELHLLCNVKRAENLQPKESKPVPDVICHLSIYPSSQQVDPSAYSRNIADWLESGVVSVVKKTTFAPSTLNPIWHQSFQLSLNDPPKEMIVAEVWGRRNKASQSKKPKEYYEKPDNFIGRAFYLLKSTPIDGEDRTLSLYSHSGKHERGTIDLHLSIKGQQEDVPVNVSIREHTLLLKLIINHETKTSKGYMEGWDGRLSEKAEIILLKHVELSGISSLQEKCIRFHVYMEYHKLHNVKMFVLSEVVKEIVTADPPLRDDQKDQLWVKQLLFEMQTLHSIILNLLNGHLTEYNLKASSDLREITCIIEILKLLFSFAPFLNKIKESERDLKGSIEICIQVAVPSWFLELSRSMLKNRRDSRSSETGGVQLTTLKGLCHHCLKHSQRALKLLNPIFESVFVDYFTIFFVVLDKLLSGDVVPRIQELVETSDDQELYELYVVFKDLSKLSAHVNITKRSGLTLTKFHTYFKGKAVNWIDLGTYKCKERIEQAIEFDEKMDLGLDQPKFSSSALDTGGFLLQLGNFWKNLEWPIATDAIGYLCTIIEQLSQMSLHYVESLYHTLLRDSSAMYDSSSGRFQSSERLCAILNNMYHVKKTLADMPVTLELDQYYEWLESECNQLGSKLKIGSTITTKLALAGKVGIHYPLMLFNDELLISKLMDVITLGNKAKKLVNSLLMSHDEDIENKISYFVDRITERLTPDISHFFELIVPNQSNSMKRGRASTDHLFPGIHWPWHKAITDEKLSNDDAIAPLLDYLASNLQILGDYLLTPVLNGILHKLWNVVIGVVQGRIAVIPRNSSVIYLYERLQYFMYELKNFFYADGNGMALTNLETEPYKFIIEKLNLLQTHSKDLILRYLSELDEQQKYIEIGASTRQGTLQLSIGYLMDKEVLEVSVIQAKCLPGKASLSTFVEVFLLPDWLFSKSAKKTYKTATIKGTVNPFYGEEFQLPAKEVRLSELGAVLVVFVINEETSSIIGLNVLSGIMMPRLFGHVNTLSKEDNIPERKNSTLTLFTPREVASLKEIEARLEAHDQDITDFHRANPRLFQKKRRSVAKMGNREKKSY